MQVFLYLVGVALLVVGGVAVFRRGVPTAFAWALFAAAAALLGYAWPGLVAL